MEYLTRLRAPYVRSWEPLATTSPFLCAVVIALDSIVTITNILSQSFIQ